MIDGSETLRIGVAGLGCRGPNLARNFAAPAGTRTALAQSVADARLARA